MDEDEKYYNIGDIMIAEAVDRCVRVYGLEGTEQKIKEVYSSPKLKILKESFLKELYRRYKQC